jgi:hypothetical protein
MSAGRQRPVIVSASNLKHKQKTRVDPGQSPQRLDSRRSPTDAAARQRMPPLANGCPHDRAVGGNGLGQPVFSRLRHIVKGCGAIH